MYFIGWSNARKVIGIGSHRNWKKDGMKDTVTAHCSLRHPGSRDRSKHAETNPRSPELGRDRRLPTF